MFRIMVNNISAAAREIDLASLFGGFGKVSSIAMVAGRGTRFALVQMDCGEEARAAVNATDGHQLYRQPLRVAACFI
jgi:RNA recognition motif-containing protein